jgi:hypothetical protein
MKSSPAPVRSWRIASWHCRGPMIDPAAPDPIGDVLQRLRDRLAAVTYGEVATYIPELGTADPWWFGIALSTLDGHVYEAGDVHRQFTIQSVSKPFTYSRALADRALAENGLDECGRCESGGFRPKADAGSWSDPAPRQLPPRQPTPGERLVTPYGRLVTPYRGTYRPYRHKISRLPVTSPLRVVTSAGGGERGALNIRTGGGTRHRRMSRPRQCGSRDWCGSCG